MNSFVYHVPTKIYFGENQLSNLGEEVRRYGKKLLLTYGGGSIKKTGLYDRVLDELQKAEVEVFELGGIESNPSVSYVREGAALCKQEGIEVLLAVGGGSVIDCSKFIGASVYYEGDPWELLTEKREITKCLPIIDILTIAATGSEMNCGGVISNPDTQEKLNQIYPVMQPKVSFLDPTLTYSVGKYQTACGTADMLTHVMEVYFNRNQDLYMLDTVMEGIMKTVMKYASIALNKTDDYEARANLMWASSWAINGFVRGGKVQAWSCHPIEHELSAYYGMTHGHGLAILFPRWMEYVLDETTVERYYQFGCNVLGINRELPQMEVAKESIKRMETFFFDTLGLESRLSRLGIDDSKFKIMAEKSVKLGGLAYGFKPLNTDDVIEILRKCL